MLLDLTLQELDGFEVLKRVKLIYQDLPVVVITGAEDPEIDERVRTLGALDCLHKPLDMPSLRQRIVELVAQLPHPSPPKDDTTSNRN
jgi:DNA-binding response OmpR family regulator